MPVFDASRTEMSVPSTSPTLLSFASDVRTGLSKPGQRELPSIYLYDDIGTALFEVITLLPEYGLTRADERLMRRYAADILERLAPPVAVAELGSGTGKKTRWILEALARREPVSYFPIDISAAALLKCRQELAGLGTVSIVGLEKSYLDGLADAARLRRAGQTLLVLFLGSTIGNFERPAAEEFLRQIRKRLRQPYRRSPEFSYDDPAGVTRAFNLNLLARINRELGGDFLLEHFEHEARYNEGQRRIEMHLRSKRRQTISIAAAEFSCTLEPGETIWTEACHKFRADEIPGMAQRAGFICEAQWVDGEWAFAENLCLAANGLPPRA